MTAMASEPLRANIGVKDGRIAEIGDCAGAADRIIDAGGAIVTPGFIDLHTHYDGQISWDEELQPLRQSWRHHTAIMGNCGIGFAPVHSRDHDRLVRLMEGVEDIPGTALHEGLTWNWESFPDYMDAIDKIPHTVDFGVMIGHDPVRVYAMGERASAFEEASRRRHCARCARLCARRCKLAPPAFPSAAPMCTAPPTANGRRALKQALKN